MEKIKFNPELESEGGKLYRRYCEEKGIEFSITAGANFCLGYMAVKPTQGAVWVKAIEFKTHEPIYRPFRRKREDGEPEYDYGEIYVTEDNGEIFLDINNERSYEPQHFERWKDYEILDESTAPAAGREEDGVEFVEWALSEGWETSHNRKGWMKHSDETPYVLTTAQLYELFKQQKH